MHASTTHAADFRSYITSVSVCFLLVISSANAKDARRGSGVRVMLSSLGSPTREVASSSRSLARPYFRQRQTPVTHALLCLNGGAFLISRGAMNGALFRALSKTDAMIRRGQYYRLVSACALHASTTHLIVNSMSLNSLSAVEQWFGSRRFVSTYVTAGVAGNLLSFAVGRSPVAVGASGAIFGLLGAHSAFLVANRRFFEAHGMDVQVQFNAILQTCALNAALGLGRNSRIDNMCHLGGLLGGAASAALWGPRLHRLYRVSGRAAIVDQPLVRLPWDTPRASRSPHRRRKR